MLKHSSKKILTKPSKPLQKSTKKLQTGEKLKKSAKLKKQRPDTRKEVPRTCLDSPIQTKFQKAIKRLSSCESQRVMPLFKLPKTLKKSNSKERNHYRKNTFHVKTNNFEEILISPIKKISLDFLNNEDHSMMKVLEIL